MPSSNSSSWTAKNNALVDGADALSQLPAAIRKFLDMTYNKSKRENICRFVDRPPCMGFRAPPHPVAGLFPNHVTPWGDMSCIFQISELDLVNDNLIIAILPVDKNIVCFYIYEG